MCSDQPPVGTRVAEDRSRIGGVCLATEEVAGSMSSYPVLVQGSQIVPGEPLFV